MYDFVLVVKCLWIYSVVKCIYIYTVADPGFPVGGGTLSHWGAADLQCGCFSTKTYAKMKELDPVGGAHTSGTPLDPPMI